MKKGFITTTLLIGLGIALVGGVAYMGNKLSTEDLALGGAPATWIPSSGYLKTFSPTYGVQVESLVSCDTIDTDADGKFSCGTDGGGGGAGSGTVATSTALVDTYVTYATGADTIGAESAFTYDDATNLLTVPNATTTLLSGTTAWFTNFIGSLTGNADTATSLASNGTNASAGNAILGVDASGNAEGSFDVWTEAENTSAGYIANVVEDTTPQLGGDLSGQSTYDITGVVDLTLTNKWLSQQGNLGLSLTDATDDLTLTADVGGTNRFDIDTSGTFLSMIANPGPSNDYLMFTFSETQGASTEINFYEGGTGHNRIWNSGSMRLGGSASNLCSTLTSDVDCDTTGTGADLVVQDDGWFGGKLFATESTTTYATSTHLSAITSFDFLGTVITNVSTWFNGLFDTQLATKNTGDLAEGSNLYWTDTRFDNRLSATTTLPALTTLANLSITESQISDLTHYADSDVNDLINASTTIARTSDLHDAVTLAGSLDYLTLSGQEITRGAIDLTTDTTGTLGETSGGTGQSTYTTGDILYSDASNSLAKLGAGTDGQVLKLASGVPSWGTDNSGGGGGSGAFATTTDSGIEVIYAVESTSDFTLGGSGATSTSKFHFDESESSLRVGSGSTAFSLSGVADSYINSGFNFGLGTTSPYAKLSVVGETVASHFTATTTSTNTFPNANITKLVNLTSNGFVKTSGSDGTLSVSTAVDLTSDITGTLPVANGGTGATSLNDLLTLGTHTTGNYLATLSSSGSITVANSGSESAAVTADLNMGNANTWTAAQTFNTATTTIQNLDVTTAISVLGEYFTNFTTYVRSLFTAGTGLTVTAGQFALDLAANLAWTGAHDFGGATSVEIPNGADPTVNASGEIAVNTTTASSSLRFYDGSDEVALYKVESRTLSYASSTLAYLGSYGTAGTTTVNVMNNKRPVKLHSFYCKTDTGTAFVHFSDGTNDTESVQCTSSGAVATVSTNNTWIARENFVAEVGTSASSPNIITITAELETQAD